MVRTTSSALRRLLPAVLTAVAVAAPLPALAQPPGGFGARGYQMIQAQQQQRQRAAAAARTPAPPPPQVVAAPRPAAAPSATVTVQVQQPAAQQTFVAIRGPDGEVRRFPIEGGRSAVVVEPLVVGPGQAVTLFIRPQAPAP